MPPRGRTWATGPTTGGLPPPETGPLWKTAPLRSDGPLRGRGRPLPTAGPSAIDGVLHQEGQSFTNGPAGHQGPTRTHTHIHTHAHKYTYKYIDLHIHRQSAGECRYDAFCFNARSLHIFRCVYHTYTTHPRTVCFKARTPPHAHTPGPTSPPGFSAEGGHRVQMS